MLFIFQLVLYRLELGSIVLPLPFLILFDEKCVGNGHILLTDR